MREMPPGFVVAGSGGDQLWVRQELEAVAPSLRAAWNGVAPEWIGGGRAAHPVVPLPDGGRAVVRRYLRGGLMRHLNRDRYFRGDRALHEARVLEYAKSAGLRVPEAIAFGRRSAAPGYRAMLATRLVEGARDGEAVLRAATHREAFLTRLGAALGRMHGCGIGHADLNLRNVLEDPHGAIWLLDFDRAALMPGGAPPATRRSNLLRLARSAVRLQLPFTPGDLAALSAGYGESWPLPRG